MKCVAIIINYAKSGVAALTEEVCVQLRHAGIKPFIIKGDNVSAVLEAERCEAMIVIGGDGTILSAARMAVPCDIPVLGVNMGRLGFLAGVERHEIGMLSRLATGDFMLEHRMLLETKVLQGGETVREHLCINDAVVSRYATPRMVEIPVACDGHKLVYHGDGVIFSTPTGSTAYAFSAGGPVVDPRFASILLTPIRNHRLFNRAILFAPDTEFVTEITQEGMALTHDGEPQFVLSAGQTVTVRRAKQTVRFIRIKEQSVIDILSEKLN